jgi:hypothetical protein
MMGLSEEAGFGMNITPIQNVPDYKGHPIRGWQVDFEFTGAAMPPGGPFGPEQMAAMQQGIVDAIYGKDFRSYAAVADDIYVAAQGGDALNGLKATLDRLDAPPSTPGRFPAAEDLPGDVIGVGFMSVERFVSSYMQAVGKGMADAGMPFGAMFSALRFAEGPPTTMAEWVNEDGSVGMQVHVPVSMPRNIFQGIMMMAMPMMQQGGMGPRMP